MSYCQRLVQQGIFGLQLLTINVLPTLLSQVYVYLNALQVSPALPADQQGRYSHSCKEILRVHYTGIHLESF